MKTIALLNLGIEYSRRSRYSYSLRIRLHERCCNHEKYVFSLLGTFTVYVPSDRVFSAAGAATAKLRRLKTSLVH